MHVLFPSNTEPDTNRGTEKHRPYTLTNISTTTTFITPFPVTQVNLRSLGRKRYAHLNEEGTEIEVDANVPWGEDTLFTLEFRDHKYAIHTSNNRYLHMDGKVVLVVIPDKGGKADSR
ncbi:Protein singed [Portunus trituberculatus]|uniref:Protein singed n=1 Tax=Portunus trituberculatus TaxID=210409 RepID=A0A5B7HT81_PORTR|nr:Protein singed [Portunus trituberculatus]